MTDSLKFSGTTAAKIGKSAMYICAKPDCLRFTGYETSEGKPRALAEAAHMLPASDGGPRSDEGKRVDVKSSSNGIWLCLGCHQKIDDDPKDYPVETLKKWKDQQSRIVKKIVGKDLEAALLALGKDKKGYEEGQEFLSFLESKRVLYEGMDLEFPPRVLESLDLIRERIVYTRARVPADSEIFFALQHIQDVIRGFLKNIGPSTDLKSLRWDNNDPVWVKFSSELTDLRLAIVVIMKVVAQKADYKLTWM